MQFKLTKKEKSWILYDVGNSAFVLMVSTMREFRMWIIWHTGGMRHPFPH